MLSGTELAGLIVAVFWAILVSFLALVLVRLAQALRSTRELVAGVTEHAVPLLAEATAAVRSAQSQLDRVETITADVREVTANASALSSTVATAFGGPLVKVAAFGYGVRRAVGKQGEQAERADGTARAERAGEGRGGGGRRGRAARRVVTTGRLLPGARRAARKD